MKPAPTFQEIGKLLKLYCEEKQRTLSRLVDKGISLDALSGLSLRELRDLESGPYSWTYPPPQQRLF